MNIDFNNGEFIKSILNGMHDWVRVIDLDGRMIFVNRAMEEALGYNPIGKKCYEALGRTDPCDVCISRQAVFDGHTHEKEEIIGNRVFSVICSPLRNSKGEIIGSVEVLRDVTKTREMQERVLKQNLKLQYDLNIARKLQCSLLPKNLPEDKLKFSFIYRPCEAIGGDFLDIFRIDDEHLGIYIADVSGHGVPASMLTIFLRSTIDRKLLSPAEALTALFKEYNRSGFDPDLYITVFYAIINMNTRTMVYSNAGHNVPPILFNTDRFEILRLPGVPISNWVEDPQYINASVQLNPGDRLFMYTDGIAEIKNSQGYQYGEDRLLNILLNDRSSPSGTLNKIVDDAARFMGCKSSDEVCDDITMVLMEVE